MFKTAIVPSIREGAAMPALKAHFAEVAAHPKPLADIIWLRKPGFGRQAIPLRFTKQGFSKEIVQKLSINAFKVRRF